MVGSRRPTQLPPEVLEAIGDLFALASSRLGPVRFEWVYDGTTAWVVQMHSGATVSSGRTIFPGRPEVEHRFAVEDGLEALRELTLRVHGTGEGIVLVGDVGVTSHFGDILRKASISSRVEQS